ncbi:MAG: thiamine-phosphate synthase family protein [Candidatus Aenigmarchaeota archaeon]|nr:thiamine-phosphate synthase family protein [Candidatus Aenigmarchaeota archaeon]
MNEKEKVLKDLAKAIRMIEGCKEFTHLMPEVRVNVVYALSNAKEPVDVAGVDGRITVVKNYPKASGDVIFGASDHMARLVLEIRKYDQSIRAGMNFKCNPEIIEHVKKFCEEEKLSFGKIDRRKEPKELLKDDKKSMPWKVKELMKNYGKVPVVFYETEGWGKEPLFVIIGKNPIEVVKTAIKIAKSFKNS